MRRSIHLVVAFLFLVAVRVRAEDYTAPGVAITVGDPNGVRFKPLSALEVGDSLSVELSGARPRATVEMLLQDARGKEWSYSRVHADARGGVGRTLFWYQSGVIGTTARRIEHRPDPSFLTFDEAERYFDTSGLTLIVRERDGRLLARRDVRPTRRKTPFVYPSNGNGVLENAINAKDESLYVTGKNFPAGATVQLFLVPNRYGWAANDAFQPVKSKTITLAAGATSFTSEILQAGDQAPGTYDIIARVGSNGINVLQASDLVSFGADTGVVVYYIIINGNIVIDSAGRLATSTAYFQFSNAFEKGEDVWAAVDPTDVPAGHTGGNYAAYWTVDHQPASYWDTPNPPPALSDVSGDGPEIHRVKYGCINGTTVRIWAAATQPEPMKGYDVVVDFGAVAANSSNDFVADNTYNQGLDFLDGYGDVGFWVFEDPGSVGPYAVGQVDYLDPNGISGITDPTGQTGPTYPVTLGWARIMYPATSAGTQTPVAPGGPYPVALFLHGRHATCDSDGPGADGDTWGSFGPCAQANRIPSHEGYDYIMQRLASQGIFCISINAHDIQPDNGQWNYDARGRLILKFLDKLRDWSTQGGDPWNNLFLAHLDMTRIALSGHSRGGEGVVAADVLNASWPTPHSIVAVNSIAPTDQDAMTHYEPSVPYFLLVGARDGDVSDMQGFRTYDRAYPQTMLNRKMKASAWVYGANHNYFNTIWTPTADLGSFNGWAGSVDDCTPSQIPGPVYCTQAMLAAAQRQIALTTIAAFFRWHLLGVAPYREILTGVVKPASMDNANVFMTFQDPERDAIDDFEQQPLDPFTNSVGGAVTESGFTLFEERLLNLWGTMYNPPPPADPVFFHDTLALKLAWNAPQTYTTDIPAGPHRNVSAYTHLTFRVGKKATDNPPIVGPDVVLYVDLEDAFGHIGTYTADSSSYARIPHPFIGSAYSNVGIMNGVRIPLQFFTRNNSGVDLQNIAKITIWTNDPAEVAIDDIEFGK